MEVILTVKKQWRQGTNFPNILAGVLELTPTLYSLFVLNLPPPTHPSLYLQPLEILLLFFALFPFPCYLYTVSLFHFIPKLSFLFFSPAFFPPVSTALFLMSGMYYLHNNILCKIKQELENHIP